MLNRSERFILIAGVCLLSVGTLAAQEAARTAMPTSGTSSGTGVAPVGTAETAVPPLIKFTGEARDLAGKPITGVADVTFSIYSQQAGGEPLWFETQTVQLDSLGRYTVLLGAARGGVPLALFSTGEARWLGVEVGNGPEQPRVLLLSVPYALKAADAETLGGRPLSDFLLKNSSNGTSATGTATTTRTFSTATTTNSTAITNIAPTAVTTAGGTVGAIPMWDSASDLTNSALFQSGSNVGIGTTNPAYALDVAGQGGDNGNSIAVGDFVGPDNYGYSQGSYQLRNPAFNSGAGQEIFAFGAEGYQTSSGLVTGNSSEPYDFYIYDTPASAYRLYVQGGTGNVGIGTTTPAHELDVAGDINASGNVVSAGTVTATSFSGSGSGLTSLTAANIASGTAGISITGNAATATSATTAASATNAAELGGVAASGYALVSGDTNYILNGTGAQTANLNITGTGTFGGAVSGASFDGALLHGASNSATGTYDTVAGGQNNAASTLQSAVGGGNGNTASNNYATVAGGFSNTASGSVATVSGGSFNTASGSVATVSGGSSNTASGEIATVAGGLRNTASGFNATVAGGQGNTASGQSSFAAGCGAKAVNNGDFVWSGYNGSVCTTVTPSGVGQFVALAPGGVIFYSETALTTGVTLAAGGGTWASLSDRNAKRGFQDVDGATLLARLNRIPMMTWSYKTQKPSIRHMGPMAQDLYAAFHLGEDNKHIDDIDGQAVALAGVQALYRLSLEKDAEIRQQRREIEQLQKARAQMMAVVERLDSRPSTSSGQALRGNDPSADGRGNDSVTASLVQQNRKLAREVAQLQKAQAHMMAVVERLARQQKGETRLARVRF